MLNNRILVIGLENRYLDLLSQIKTDFIFIYLPNPSVYNPSMHLLEGVIFNSLQLLELGDIIKDFKSKPIFGIGKGPKIEGITWLENIPKPDEFEAILVEALGTSRAPPSKTGEFAVGTIVKNKTFPSWGLGVVKTVLEDDLFIVSFPSALKLMKTENHTCHKTTLRIICTIKELTNETNQ